MDETLVAVVEMLLLLELLKRVKAEVDVPALEVVLVELRQFPETIELALEATGRPEPPLRVLLGEAPRSGRCSPKAQVSKGLGLVEKPKVEYLALDLTGIGEPLARRPLVQVEDDASSDLGSTDPAVERGGDALRPMIRFVTLLAVVDMGCW